MKFFQIGLEESFKLLTSKYDELKIQKLILESKVEENSILEENFKRAHERILALETMQESFELKNALLQENVQAMEVVIES